jgi:glucose-1-phosphate adenylyltransferase
MPRKRVLAMVMAGGQGTRLDPLTRFRAKPAVPFAGKYRIIDYVLSNLVNSGIHSIYVLTQFKSQSLTDHLQNGWMIHGLLPEHFVTAVPAQMRTGQDWYRGTADAIYQNLDLVEATRPDILAVFGGDHVYRMDVGLMVRFHAAKGADATIAAIAVPRSESARFGVLQVDADWRVVGFQEKPRDGAPIPGDPDHVLASMGNYLFEPQSMAEEVEADAAVPDSAHDFGQSILPKMIGTRRVYAYDFRRNRIPGMLPGEDNTYWRDVGTLDAYFEANMDLKNPTPIFSLYNREWPIRTSQRGSPPAKFVRDEYGRDGVATNSLVNDGCLIIGAQVSDSVLGRNVIVRPSAAVRESILFDDVEIGRGAVVQRAIIDKNAVIPDGDQVGVDLARDRTRYTVTESGLVVVPKFERSTRPIASLEA